MYFDRTVFSSAQKSIQQPDNFWKLYSNAKITLEILSETSNLESLSEVMCRLANRYN